MFIDKVEISIKAGDGGNGHTSFFRDKLTMHGGPDGGDGGRGGNIVFIGTTREDNLINFRFAKKFKAADGGNGGTRNRNGANGQDLKIPVPLGTKIFKTDADSAVRRLLCDITAPNAEFTLLRGGAGGRGNARFATSRRQTPNFSQTGIKTETYKVTLELNCIADVGLIGFPNVGKSTLLSVISRANPKIANYHFTTLTPNIAVTAMFEKNFIVADIPGLIEGASKGAGLGIDFLKHISRTRLLVHVVDISQQDGRDAVEDFRKINRELAEFSAELAAKPQIVALNKCDSLGPDAKKIIADFKKGIKDKTSSPQIFEISAITRGGIDDLMRIVASELAKIPKAEPQTPEAVLEQKVDKNTFDIQEREGEFFVTGPLIENLIRGVVLSDTESNAYFQRRLVESGIIDALKQNGMKEGDTVHVADTEFEYFD